MELNALCARWRQVERQQDQRAALIACTIANANGCTAEIDDFMPKTGDEIQEANAMRLLAWFEGKVAAGKARERDDA